MDETKEELGKMRSCKNQWVKFDTTKLTKAQHDEQNRGIKTS